MKNRTVYEVLDSVMENYSYTIEKEGKKVSLSGKVYISKIDVTVTHEKTFYQNGNSRRTILLIWQLIERMRLRKPLRRHCQRCSRWPSVLKGEIFRKGNLLNGWRNRAT